MTPIEFGSIEQMIMNYAYEDWFGLFELRPWIDSAGPRRAEGRRKDLLAAFERLMEAGLVEIAVRPDLLTEPGPALPTPAAIALIHADDSWANPAEEGQPVVTFTATHLGDRFMKRGGTA